MNVGIFLFDSVTMLDAYAPLQFLSAVENFNTFTFSKDKKNIKSDAGIELTSNYTFEDCPHIDILLVPGTGVPINIINDKESINFLKKTGLQAKYVTSVCTGSVILAETGLLDGFKTTSHWAYKQAFFKYPLVEFVEQRVVIDRNRISGGGVTAGIDFALMLIGELVSQKEAERIQLLFEYDPAPPFNSGNPKNASTEITHQVEAMVKYVSGGLFSD